MAASKIWYRHRVWHRPVRTSPYRLGSVTRAGDVTATVLADDGETLVAYVPNNLWPYDGCRVALYRYPAGWVIVGMFRRDVTVSAA